MERGGEKGRDELSYIITTVSYDDIIIAVCVQVVSPSAR